MRDASWVVVVGIVLVGASCVEGVDESDRRCPCGAGWTCCESAQVCLPEGTVCGPKADQGPGPKGDGAIVSEGLPLPDARPGQEAAPIVCVPDKVECVGIGSKRKCNTGGTAFLPTEACPDQQRCASGTCVTAGLVEGQVRISISVKAKDMILDIDPGEYTTSVGIHAGFQYDAPGSTPWTMGPEGCKKILQGGTTTTPGVPFDAGTISFSGLPGGPHTLAFDPQAKIYYKGLSSFDSHFNPFPGYGKSVGFSAAGAGLLHGPFSGSLLLPPERRLTRPGPREELTTSTTQPLDLAWSGATGSGFVTVTLIPLPSPIPPGTYTPPFRVQCDMTDDGAFTIPAASMSDFVGYPKAGLMMRVWSEQKLTAKGLGAGTAVVDYFYWPSRSIVIK